MSQPPPQPRPPPHQRWACGDIPVHDRAPTTEEEWREALRYYAADRQTSTPEMEQPCAPCGPSTMPGQLLIHKERGDALDYHTDEDDHHEPNRPMANGSGDRKRPHIAFDLSRDIHVLGGTAADDSPSKSSPTSPRADPKPKVHRKQSTDDPLAFKSLAPRDTMHAFESHCRFVDTEGLPRATRPDEDEHPLCAMMERNRIREHYEREGWLPAPNPSQELRERRSRVVRRLGLNDSSNLGERYAVISKYRELAQIMFNCDGSAVGILRGDMADVYLSGKGADKPTSVNGASSYVEHVVLIPDGRCFVVGDLEHDWRFAKNPYRSLETPEPRFLAAAPLRYHGSNGDYVDFGILAVSSAEPRTTFDLRDQTMLLRLSNLLVYQLATLQSEIVAKQSSAMYESSINFLRRSLVPDQFDPRTAAEAKEAEAKVAAAKAKKAKARARRKHHMHKDIHRPLPAKPTPSKAHDLVIPRGVGPPASVSSTVSECSSSPLPLQRAVKSGPRDSRRAKKHEFKVETALFTDASDTLRGILNADAVYMVDFREYQLYLRRGGTLPENQSKQSKEAIISDFHRGMKWPENVEPVAKYIARSDMPHVDILGQSIAPGFEADFNSRPDATGVMERFIQTYLTDRHFWWDREDSDDELAQDMMSFMPDSCQTMLSTLFMTFNGMPRYAIFAAWEQAPGDFDDTSRLALPFVWIIGATLVSGLAISRIRSVEENQITYSNLQAHELRTPLHQILAITQLLRSSITDLADAPTVAGQNKAYGNMTTLEQVRDLLPFLDAIDTSGKTLHGIVDNILTFLDLTGKDKLMESMRGKHPALLGHRQSAPQTLGHMLEELVQEAYDEGRRSRMGGPGPEQGHIETIFEVVSQDAAELVTEDSGGALRRALSRLISNAYRYIDGPGCVEIYIDDVRSQMLPEGCETLSNVDANLRRVSLRIIDSGKGMALDFVENKLGEPWAKEDLFATGSGLSVHLAYRIIDLMDGEMEISSAPGAGTIVSIEVPLPSVQKPNNLMPGATLTPVAEVPATSALPRRKVALVGFDCADRDEFCAGLRRLGATLKRQYTALDCDIVSPADADLVVMDGGGYERDPSVADVLATTRAAEIVVFECDDTCPAAATLTIPAHTRVRHLRKPVTPTLVKASLSRTPARPTPIDAGTPSAPDTPARRNLRLHFDDESIARSDRSEAAAAAAAAAGTDRMDAKGLVKPGKESKGFSFFGWKSRGMCVEEAVASLCMGDYFASRGRLGRAPSNGSSANGSSTNGSSGGSTPLPEENSTGASSTDVQTPSEQWGTSDGSSRTRATTPPPAEPDFATLPPPIVSPPPPSPPKPEPVNVLVVEDNGINRKLLVRILQTSRLNLKVFESEDGLDAVERFKRFEAPVIVLLDINMPRMDGYAAAVEMRLHEKSLAAAGGGGYDTPSSRSQILAMTALAGEEDRRRGLVECGMDRWLTKPCDKRTVQKAVEEAVSLLAPTTAALLSP